MDRLQRFEALTVIPEPAAIRLAERILDGSLGDVAVITPPTVGMVMARAQDGARGEVFNLGEVLVTEARVSIEGREGWGMVLGRAPDHALSVAVVDAGLEAGHRDGTEIERDLADLAAEAAAKTNEEWVRVAPTRVQFDVFYSAPRSRSLCPVEGASRRGDRHLQAAGHLPGESLARTGPRHSAHVSRRLGRDGPAGHRQAATGCCP